MPVALVVAVILPERPRLLAVGAVAVVDAVTKYFFRFQNAAPLKHIALVLARRAVLLVRVLVVVTGRQAATLHSVERL